QQRTVPDDGRLRSQEAEEPGREYSSGGDHSCGRRSRRLVPDQHSACGDQADCTGAAPDQTLKRITHARRSVMLRSRMMIAAMVGGWVVLSANAAAAADLPADLAQVPPDAAAFIHVRVGDIYKSEQLKDLRDVVAKAGPEALKALSERFVPDPTTLERVTLFAIMPAGDEGGPPMPIPSVVFHMSKRFDSAK